MLAGALNWYRGGITPDRKSVGKISVPTVLIWGNQDSAIGRPGVTATPPLMDGPYRLVELARISHHVACANNKCFEYQLLVSDSQGVGICRLRWPRPRRSFGPVRARATSTVGPLCFSVASTRTGPKSSAIIAARGEKCGLDVGHWLIQEAEADVLQETLTHIEQFGD